MIGNILNYAWFKYNSFTKPTSQQFSKHISWHIKCSNNNLPTLDILNRNYPNLLNNYDTCFMCSSTKETNDHFWNCPQVLKLITPIFDAHYNKFKTLITSESNSYTHCILTLLHDVLFLNGRKNHLNRSRIYLNFIVCY